MSNSTLSLGLSLTIGVGKCTNYAMKAFTLLLTVLLFASTSATPAEQNTPSLTIKGFGTAGISGTDTDRLKFRRNTSEDTGVDRSAGFDIDSRLGLQLDAEFSESWHAAVQWVARSHPGDFVEQNLDWAFLRWRPQPDLDLRLGRLGFDVFLLSDYRNVGYAYPWIRPPHEFYAGLPIYHFDGADIAKKFSVGDGYLTLKSFGGYAFYQVPTAFSQIFDAESVLAGGSLAYEQGSWRARIGYVYTENISALPLQPLVAAVNDPLVRSLWPGGASVVNSLSVNDKAVQFSSIGLAYDDGVWLAQLEGAYIDSEVASYPSVANGYLSLGRRFDSLTVYSLLGIAESLHARVDVPQPLVPAPALIGYRNFVDGLLNKNGVDEKSVSLGLRWDIYENIALKAQWSHYWLGQNGTQLWLEPPSGPTPAEVNVWSLGVDFVF